MSSSGKLAALSQVLLIHQTNRTFSTLGICWYLYVSCMLEKKIDEARGGKRNEFMKNLECHDKGVVLSPEGDRK